MTDQRFNQPLPNRPLLRIDADALLPDTFRYAEERFRRARHLLESLEGADDCDIRRSLRRRCCSWMAAAV
jgi:hypothetical protein